MATYIFDVVGDSLIIKGFGKDIPIKIEDVLLLNSILKEFIPLKIPNRPSGLGADSNLRWSNIDNFKKQELIEIIQQIINYLDTLKDSDKKYEGTLQGLALYPLENKNVAFPKYKAHLDFFEQEFLEARINQLSFTSWLKINKGDELFEKEKKDYGKVFWESGLGEDKFVKKGYDKIITFGSFIDPLSKTDGKSWPENGKSIEITEKVMKLFGFGESKIYAKTIGNKYEYNVKIGCGINNPYFIEKDIEKYSKGNAVKNSILEKSSDKLKKSGITGEKIKLFMIKEWGDKLQVLIYFMYYHSNKGEKPIMITCDLVVFVLCLTIKIPCIYTGAQPFDILKKKYPNFKIPTERCYSILEYKPSETPLEDALYRFKQKMEILMKSNKQFINAIKSLTKQNYTTLEISGDRPIDIKREFFSGILKDIEKIQIKFETIQNSFIDNAEYKTTQSVRNTRNKNKKNENIDEYIKIIDNKIIELEKDFRLIPFIKQPRKNDKTLSLNVSLKGYYTYGGKFAINENNFENPSKMLLMTSSFYLLAKNNYIHRDNAKGGMNNTHKKHNYNKNKRGKTMKKIGGESSEKKSDSKHQLIDTDPFLYFNDVDGFDYQDDKDGKYNGFIFKNKDDREFKVGDKVHILKNNGLINELNQHVERMKKEIHETEDIQIHLEKKYIENVLNIECEYDETIEYKINDINEDTAILIEVGDVHGKEIIKPIDELIRADIDLLKELKDSFDETMELYHKKYKQLRNTDYVHFDDLKEFIYMLFVHYCYIHEQTPIIFNDEILQIIIKEYENLFSFDTTYFIILNKKSVEKNNKQQWFNERYKKNESHRMSVKMRKFNASKTAT